MTKNNSKLFDLIDECGEDLSSCGYETVELKQYGIQLSKLFVDSSSKAKRLGFNRGHYFIINAPLLSSLMEEHCEILQAELSCRLEFLFKENKIKNKARVLFVGIGNPEIIADSFGVLTVNKISINPYKKNNRIFKIVPNIFSNTGLNAYDIIRLIVEAFDISLVFLFDSLATSNISRLGTSLQINDAGLTPGSAINNFGRPINKNTLNVPCFVVGVPTMILSSDFGVKMKNNIILTEKDAKEKVEFLSSLVAEVVDDLMK